MLSKADSLLVVPISDDDPIEPLDPSFLEYLMDNELCSNPDFVIHPVAEQIHLTLICFKRMERGMQVDREQSSVTCDNKASDRFPDVPMDLQYACLHWISHLSRSPPGEPILVTAMNMFFSCHIPYWLKNLSFMGRIKSALPHLHLARTWLSGGHSRWDVVPSVNDTISHSKGTLSGQTADSLRLVADTERFILTFYDVLLHNPFHIYTCIAFVPTTSMLRQSWGCNMPYVTMRVVCGLDNEWGLLKKVGGHLNSVASIAFSSDCMRIVSGSVDKTMRIWDATTGTELKRLQGHGSSVYSVAFSPDSMRVVSGSYDEIVRIWDVTTGTELKRLEGHWRPVQSVAFSPDSMRIVSGSSDKTVRIWDATTGAELTRLEGHGDMVSSVAFSPDVMHIVSGSYDMTVRIWDATTGVELKRLEGHESSVLSATFSPDSMRIVSGSHDMTVRIWDATTGTELKKLEGHGGSVWSVAFSPDSMCVVSGSGDKTVRIWDATTGTELERLEPEGQKGYISSVAFSLDGKHIVSRSYDSTRVWDSATGASLNMQADIINLPPEGVTDQVEGAAVESYKAPSYRLADEWVVGADGTKICWVPHQYKGTAQACLGEKLVIGTLDGRVMILEFAPAALSRH